MKKLSYGMCMLAVILFITGCTGKTSEEREAKKEKVHNMYVDGLSNKLSPQFKYFFEDYLTSIHYKVLQKADSAVYATSYAAEESGSMTYYELKDESVEELYEELVSSKEPSKIFAEILRRMPEERKPLSAKEAGLPEITYEKGRGLSIFTQKGSENFSLEELSAMEPLSDNLIFQLLVSNEDNLLIEIEDVDKGKYVFLFSKQDFSKHATIEETEKDMAKAYADGKLSDFDSLFEKVGSKGEYETFVPGSPIVFDKTKRTVANINEEDLLSKDGKLVYLNGASPGEGEQKLVSLESYLTNPNQPGETFEIDGKAIAK